jgi:hypothetical protein
VTSEKDFHRRANDRRVRLNGLTKLFQDGEIPTKKFKHLANLLRAEHNRDARESGVHRSRDLE